MPNSGGTFSEQSNNDTRFQFEVIKQLAESVRVNGDVMRDIQQTQVNMLERLARIEEHKFHEAVGKLSARVDAIDRHLAEERGAVGARNAVLKWWPVIGMALLVFWTAGRALGFFHLPDRPAIERRVNQDPVH